MTDCPQPPPASRSRWQFSLFELFRVQAGVAGVVAVAAYVHRLHAGWSQWFASGSEFAATTVSSALVGYVFCRGFFGRLTGLLAGIALAGAAGSSSLGYRDYRAQEFAFLGMLVACSLFLGFGWIDRGTLSFLKRKGNE